MSVFRFAHTFCRLNSLHQEPTQAGRLPKSVKGISPIIASVLVVLVAVSLVSAYTLWIGRVVGTVQEAGGEEVKQTATQLFSDLRIEGVNKQTVTIKNTGASQLSASALTVFFDEEPVTHAADFDVLEPDELGTLTLRGLWRFGHGAHSLKVSAGRFSDTTDVTLEPPPGRVMDLRFEEGSGTTANDASGNANDGTLWDGNTTNSDGNTPPAWVRDTPYKNSEFALRFDGVDAFVNVSDSPSLRGMSALTIEAWFKHDEHQTSNPRIVDTNDNNYRLIIRNANDKLETTIWNASAVRGDVASSVKTDFGEWAHAVVSYDNTTIRMFVNGVEAGSTPLPGPVNNAAATLWIGSKNASADLMKGVIDEVRVYNRAYEPDELYVLKPR